MYKSVIVVKNKNELVPDEVLSQILAKNTSFFGMAVAENGVIKLHKMKFLKDDKKLSVQDINNVQNHADYKGKQLVMSFGTCDLPTESCIQPFLLLENDSKKSTLVMFMDGNFDEFAKTGSARSAAEFAFEDYFKGKLKKEDIYHDHDLKKIMEAIKGTELSRDFAKTMIGDRGSLAFLAGNGDLHALSVKSDATQKKFSWGWISDMGVEPVVEAKEAPKSGADAILAGLGSAAVKDDNELPEGPARRSVLDFKTKLDNPAKPDAPVDGAAKSGRPDKQSDTVGEKKTITFKVPDNLFAAGEQHRLKKWLRNRLPGGVLPKDYATRRTWTIEYEGAPKAAKESAVEYENDLANLGERMKTATAPPPSQTSPVPKVIAKKGKISFTDGDAKATGKEKEYPPSSDPVTIPDKHKDATPHHIGNDSPPAIIGMSSPVIPPAEAAEMKGIVQTKEFQEAVSLQGQLMEDPKKWKAYTSSIPSFAAQLGYSSIEETIGWTYQSMLPMTQSCPKAVLVWGHNWMQQAMKWKDQLDAANRDIDELLSKDGNKELERATSGKSNKLDFGNPKQTHAM